MSTAFVSSTTTPLTSTTTTTKRGTLLDIDLTQFLRVVQQQEQDDESSSFATMMEDNNNNRKRRWQEDDDDNVLEGFLTEVLQPTETALILKNFQDEALPFPLVCPPSPQKEDEEDDKQGTRTASHDDFPPTMIGHACDYRPEHDVVPPHDTTTDVTFHPPPFSRLLGSPQEEKIAAAATNATTEYSPETLALLRQDLIPAWLDIEEEEEEQQQQGLRNNINMIGQPRVVQQPPLPSSVHYADASEVGAPLALDAAFVETIATADELCKPPPSVQRRTTTRQGMVDFGQDGIIPCSHPVAITTTTTTVPRGPNNIVNKHYDREQDCKDWQEELQSLHQRHVQQAPVPHLPKEKHLDFLWHEFAELIKAAQGMGGGGGGGVERPTMTSTPCSMGSLLQALQQEQEQLVQAYARRQHTKSAAVHRAKQVVQARQKRRKQRRISKTSNHTTNGTITPKKKEGQATSPPRWIQPWHIVLGDHSTRSRTVGTMALRYFCVHVKHKGMGGSQDVESIVLGLARRFLQQAFPEEPDAGLLLYLQSKASAPFVASTQEPFVFAAAMGEEDECGDNGWNNNNNANAAKTTFLPVAKQQELQVVKRVYTKLQPGNERSLSEIVQAYRTLLQERKEQHRASPRMQIFEKLLFHCQAAQELPLTPTALNGLRESLDEQWAILTQHDEGRL